jgi:hypothetical protein
VARNLDAPQHRLPFDLVVPDAFCALDPIGWSSSQPHLAPEALTGPLRQLAMPEGKTADLAAASRLRQVQRAQPLRCSSAPISPGALHASPSSALVLRGELSPAYLLGHLSFIGLRFGDFVHRMILADPPGLLDSTSTPRLPTAVPQVIDTLSVSPPGPPLPGAPDAGIHPHAYGATRPP